ncbi:YtzI protein [Bacillus siamensis]|nr:MULTISPECIES: YtzI protein [Bacillus]MBD0408349.1 YtzI protein [Bacillus sp. 1021]MDU0811044.1 YtzI protein [Bacillus siamensis]MEC3656871.1 YtzI protein [Bacillus siamensis]MED0771423.1 YtzI protein [Bacillus siamensis]MED0777354.1 YtzI protein [Bacillus siamensis]
MLLLLSLGFLIVLAVLLLSIWSTVRAYNVKHTIDPPQDASNGLTDKNKP